MRKFPQFTKRKSSKRFISTFTNISFEHHILTPLQSGFVERYSTTYQLLHIYHTFCEAVFCDISRAFDRVWHKRLLHTSRSIGWSERVLKWFSSYLSEWYQWPIFWLGSSASWDSTRIYSCLSPFSLAHQWHQCETYWRFHSFIC